ncbi:dihydrolipoamide dehydrogenase [Myxococcaceae bacterium]|nr:dihydrolipoamide dehydrogenase [Myxococcaceae bacterium]
MDTTDNTAKSSIWTRIARSVKNQYDLCVIGGGAAGLVVAAGGAALGARVVLVEKHRLGGDCLWDGCVPSKALLHSAAVAQTLRTAARAGLDGAEPDVDLARVMERVNAVIRTLEPNDSPERFRGLGVEVVFGAGRFTAPDCFEVGGRTLAARRFVLATGSRAAIPPLPRLDRVPYLTNKTLFGLREPVPHLLVVGGGPIGVEMAQAFRRLGSAVDLLESGPGILPREDADMADLVRRRLEAEGVRFHFGSQIVAVRGEPGAVRLRLSREGAEESLAGSHLLIATGRKPNLDGLGLDQAGVSVTDGRLVLDARLRTANKRIYACGDVAGPYLFTHMAEHQAGIVLRNALFHWPARFHPRAVPWCTFCDPELARVGLSESEVERAGIPHQVYGFDFSDIDRAVADDAAEGRAKLVVSPNGKLLGAALCGPHAGELIHEYVLALSKGMGVSDLAGVIHIYPTLAQINRRVAEMHLKAKLTPAARRWMQRLFGLRGSRP